MRWRRNRCQFLTFQKTNKHFSFFGDFIDTFDQLTRLEDIKSQYQNINLVFIDIRFNFVWGLRSDVIAGNRCVRTGDFVTANLLATGFKSTFDILRYLLLTFIYTLVAMAIEPNLRWQILTDVVYKMWIE